ncbi:hypothetical protein H5410_045874 [Solanum commersonii]|uniref:Uncharacterized protein n=1 Tax=Solanum commersonii TaxID=4109 RepID=A0A9J5XEX2_SOLCO|nr:hypothetical protein H5410_045874 [Solanum commersonii]
MAYNETTLVGTKQVDQQQHHEVVSPVHIHVEKEVVQNVSSNPSNTVQEEEVQIIGERSMRRRMELLLNKILKGGYFSLLMRFFMTFSYTKKQGLRTTIMWQ